MLLFLQEHETAHKESGRGWGGTQHCTLLEGSGETRLMEERSLKAETHLYIGGSMKGVQTHAGEANKRRSHKRPRPASEVGGCQPCCGWRFGSSSTNSPFVSPMAASLPFAQSQRVLQDSRRSHWAPPDRCSRKAVARLLFPSFPLPPSLTSWLTDWDHQTASGQGYPSSLS